VYTDYIILTIAWIIYLASHSVFAAPPVKRIFAKVLGKGFVYYRIIYVVFSTLLMMLIGLYILSMPVIRICATNIFLSLTGLLMIVAGIIIVKYAFREYSLQEFMGTAYLQDRMNISAPLKTSGILSYIRHPLYSATFLIMGGFFALFPTLGSLVSVIYMTVYIFIGIKLEENKLLMEYGKQYSDYRAEVPMLIPRLGMLMKGRNRV
jgi:methanethiol S-methyltransferase